MAFENVYLEDGGARIGPVTREVLIGWVRENRVLASTKLVDVMTGEVRPIGQFPDIVAAFPVDATDFLIPKNSYALISYYVGIFSLVGILLIGVPALIGGLVAIVTGIMGLKAAKANPLIRGKAHAVTGIVLGAFNTVIGGAITVLLLIALIFGNR